MSGQTLFGQIKKNVLKDVASKGLEHRELPGNAQANLAWSDIFVQDA